MKKFALGLLLLPAVSFAENVNFVSAEFGVGGDSINTMGSIGYESVIEGKLSVGINYTETSYNDSSDYDAIDVNVDLAVGSFDTGSLYFGAGALIPYNNDSDTLDGIFASGPSDNDELLTSLTAGFAKRSGDGFDYDIGATFMDNQEIYAASLRAPLGDSDFGLTYSVQKVAGGVAVTSLGVSFIL